MEGIVLSESALSDIQPSSILNEICVVWFCACFICVMLITTWMVFWLGWEISVAWFYRVLLAVGYFALKNLNICFYEAIEVTDKEKITWLLCCTLLLCAANEFLLNLYLYCRKKKAVHKTTTTDDKRLQSTLKRIGVNAIPAIEEVNIFKDDIVIQFLNPKGKADYHKWTWYAHIVHILLVN